MATSDPNSKLTYRLLQQPYLWLTVMAAYVLFLSTSFIAYQIIDRYNSIPSFYEPTEVESADGEVAEYHSGGAGALGATVTKLALMVGISLAALISIPSATIILIGKYRAAVPTMIALVIWALVWTGYVVLSNTFIPLLGLTGTLIVIALGIKGMKRIGDMS